MNLHNIKRLLERKCLSLPKNIKSQNKSVAMEIKLDRKKNHIAASDYKEQTTVIKTTSDFKIGNNVDTNKIEGNYMVKREKETLIKIIELRKSQRDIILTLNRISIFPLQTEKQSTEILQELNKNFIIHSELSA